MATAAVQDEPATRFAKDPAIIERIERLTDIRDVYAEAKGNGF